jgi:hypothetical protein
VLRHREIDDHLARKISGLSEREPGEEGQQYATAMSYAPLPEPLVQRVEQRLKLITAVP